METAIVALIAMALMVLGGVTMSQGFLSSADTTTAGLEEMSETAGEIMRTELSILSATQPAADTLEVTLRNSGQTKLANFARWDIIVQYYDGGASYYVKWLDHTEGALGNDEWKKTGIYLDAGTSNPEVFEPGILNPGEEIVIEAKLDPSVGQGTTNLVVVSTPNGIPVSISFPGYTP